MTDHDICLTVSLPARAGVSLIAPAGFSTPHAAPLSVAVRGADMCLIADPGAAQHALILTPTAERIEVEWRYAATGAPYPEALFAPRDSRFTRSAAALGAEVRGIADGRDPAGIKALADHVAALFTYGHPEQRYYDGADEIPQICSLTVGSCVDINAYFIAACRAAGYEAGYVTGYFIPREKRTHCEDMHCWVVTRAGGLVQEWDIAHHLKLGTGDIRPGLNPKPGVRLPMAHSMGLNFPAAGLTDIKLIGEPWWIGADGALSRPDLQIRLRGYDRLAG
ncbi:transglutaminase-like domain-containing protein [Antarcticimicrobium luteum]|uniref:Transglutaminase domain-containing protein n=1 Tax=Antarcticimicrobium luteum TaxID=2547397 RepID=A0A4R5V4P5_9RHOB|nr:transglutaminase-like domain-containing protein [Antarcticimicrobium luteum]TDK46774.1 transglutaminase domain-containing protein [Antarcticimicrobium luteum]